MILPTLPDAAKSDVRAWNATKRKAARRVIVGMGVDGLTCKNCAGLGEVYISFLGAGPTKAPVTSKKPSTHIDGEGWYLIEDTKGYPCPACSGEQIVRLPGAFKPEARAQTRQVADRLTRRVDIDDEIPAL